MRVQFDLCVGACPDCGVDIYVGSDSQQELVALTCGRPDCQLEFRNAAFRQWLVQRIKDLEDELRGGSFVQKKSRAA